MLARYSSRFALLALAAWLGANPAAADFKKLMSRIPGEANVLVLVDVEKLYNSNLGKKEGWKDMRSSAYGSKPMLAPPNTKQLVLGALLAPGPETMWEVAVIELDAAPSMASIASAERGFADKVGEKPGVYSPSGAYYLQLDSNVLGVVSPPNRQFAARWASKKNTLDSAFISNYLRSASSAIEKGSEVVMVIDLEDWTSPPAVLRRLRTEPFPSIEGKKVELSGLAETIATIKGVTLRIDVGDDIKGTGVIDFNADTAKIGDLAKPLLLDVLAAAGLMIPDLQGWEAKAKDHSVTITGKLSTDGLRLLLSLIDPPAPRSEANALPPPPAPSDKGDKGDKGAKPTGDVTAAASQEYFQTVCKMLDNLDKSMGSGSEAAGIAQVASWLKRDARRMDSLPILNVDPELLDWGRGVSTSMREIAGICEVGSVKTRSATGGVAVAAWGGYDDYGYIGDAAYSQDVANRAAQRKQLALDERARTYEAAQSVFQNLRGSRAAMRQTMTKRYGVEF